MSFPSFLESVKDAAHQSSEAFHNVGTRFLYGHLLEIAFREHFSKNHMLFVQVESYLFRHRCKRYGMWTYIHWHYIHSEWHWYSGENIARTEGKSFREKTVARLRSARLSWSVHRRIMRIVTGIGEKSYRKSSTCMCVRYLWRHASPPSSVMLLMKRRVSPTLVVLI